MSAVLSDSVLLISVTLPEWLAMPPPKYAWLLVTLVLMRVSAAS
jgi:hypothetical protein